MVFLAGIGMPVNWRGIRSKNDEPEASAENNGNRPHEGQEAPAGLRFAFSDESEGARECEAYQAIPNRDQQPLPPIHA